MKHLQSGVEVMASELLNTTTTNHLHSSTSCYSKENDILHFSFWGFEFDISSALRKTKQTSKPTHQKNPNKQTKNTTTTQTEPE